MAQVVTAFWKRKTLEQMDRQERESLCDGCGLCCLQKLEDEDDPHTVYYTRIACKLLDLKTCRCSDYPNRRKHVPDCVQLTPASAAEFAWLPRPAPTAWWPKGKICRRGTTWSAEILRPCTRPASPRPGGCWRKAAWRMRIGKITSSFGCRVAISSPLLGIVAFLLGIVAL